MGRPLLFFIQFVTLLGFAEDERSLVQLQERLGLDLYSKVEQAVQETSRVISEMVCDGRLTLTSATAVTSSDVTAATTVYFTPYNGSKIALYSGTEWQMIDFTEVSVAVPATTITPFDVFGYNNGGSLTLEAANWTNDTTRATALTKQDGVYVKTGATTRRYLGTGRTTTVSGQTEDSVTKRFIWNQCNRVKRSLLVKEATGSWTYGTNAWRAARGQTTNRVEVVLGLAESPVSLILIGSGAANATEEFSIGIGIDSTTAYDTNVRGMYGAFGSTRVLNAIATLDSLPAEGYHYYQWLEISPQGGTVTFYGTTYGLTGLGGTVDG